MTLEIWLSGVEARVKATECGACLKNKPCHFEGCLQNEQNLLDHAPTDLALAVKVIREMRAAIKRFCFCTYNGCGHCEAMRRIDAMVGNSPTKNGEEK